MILIELSHYSCTVVIRSEQAEFGWKTYFGPKITYNANNSAVNTFETLLPALFRLDLGISRVKNF